MSEKITSIDLRANTGIANGEFDSVEKRAFSPQTRSASTATVAEQFNELPAHVWPKNASRDPRTGEVSIAGVRLSEIAATYGTPVFVVDEDDFRSRCREMARAFGGAGFVHYASKAFLNRTIATWVKEEGLSLDVASLGELQVALAADFPAERITAHGNNKRAEFLDLCVTKRVGHVVIDCAQEIAQLNSLCEKRGVVQDVLVRVKPGIEAHTHEFIATSHEDQKFGFSLASGEAHEACLEVAAASNLRLVGLHCHVGSQVFDAQGFSLAAKRLLGLMGQLKKDLDAATCKDITILDLGGGYGIAYTAAQTPLKISTISSILLDLVASESAELGIVKPDLYVEPGRAIVGPCCVTVYTVGTVKDVHTSPTHIRRYISVDGGMSDNIRPALYQADYEARVVNRLTSGQPVDSRLVGSHCESGDILISNAAWPDDIATGDLLAVAATGAYCYSMSSRYNMLFRPAVVAVSDGVARLILRRETIEDVLALEP